MDVCGGWNLALFFFDGEVVDFGLPGQIILPRGLQFNDDNPFPMSQVVDFVNFTKPTPHGKLLRSTGCTQNFFILQIA